MLTFKNGAKTQLHDPDQASTRTHTQRSQSYRAQRPHTLERWRPRFKFPLCPFLTKEPKASYFFGTSIPLSLGERSGEPSARASRCNSKQQTVTGVHYFHFWNFSCSLRGHPWQSGRESLRSSVHRTAPHKALRDTHFKNTFF